MQLRSFFVFLMVLGTLVACGDSTQVATDVPPATERPEPTARPTATIVAEAPTATPRPTPTKRPLPTKEPVSMTKSGIPIYALSSVHRQGDNELIDSAVNGLATGPISSLPLDAVDFHVTTESAKNIEAWYRKTMPQYDWTFQKQEPNKYGFMMSFENPAASDIAIVTVVDMAVFSPGVADKLIMITLGNPADSIADTAQVATDSEPTFPLPGSILPYEIGDNPEVDTEIYQLISDLESQDNGLYITNPFIKLLDADHESVKAFYRSSIGNYGWDPEPLPSRSENNLLFSSKQNPTMIILIGITDLSSIDPNLSGSFIWSIISSPKPLSFETFNILPVPENTAIYERGENSNTDKVVDKFDAVIKDISNSELRVNSRYTYSSSASVAELKTFYSDQYLAIDWEEADITTEEEDTVIMTIAEYEGHAVLIILVDATTNNSPGSVISVIDVGLK